MIPGSHPTRFGASAPLQTCTPNHQGVKPAPGDWIMGNSSGAEVDTNRWLIYAMRISEVRSFDEYFRDHRFACKRVAGATWWQRCGDNIYYLDEAVLGRRAPEAVYFHNTAAHLTNDTRNPSVFISEHFYYLGNNAPVIPSAFSSLVKTGRGCTWHDDEDGKPVTTFIGWLEQSYPPGILGLPAGFVADAQSGVC